MRVKPKSGCLSPASSNLPGTSSTAQLNSITEIRRRMASHVGDLKTCIAEMRADSQQATTRLESELAAIKQRLVIVEDLASTDLLTGVTNRREGERLLAKRIRAGSPFCLLLFELDKFKAVNDRYGHKWGDKVLVTFAWRLREQLRTCDTVFRLGRGRVHGDFRVWPGGSLQPGVPDVRAGRGKPTTRLSMAGR